jgi:hypothetical protein
MTNSPPEPDDILGTRPAGERRAGAAQLLRAGLGLLRQHGLRAWLLAVLTLAILFVIAQVFFTCFVITLSPTFGLWQWYIGVVANVIARAPFLAALVYSLLLLLQRRHAGAKTLFSPFRSLTLWANTALAGSAALLVHGLVPWILRSIPWAEFGAGLVDENSLLAKTFRLIPTPKWILADLPEWIGILVVLPLAWSALNVLVLGTPGFRAITQSVRLTRRHWRLAALYLAVAILLPLAHWVHVPLQDFAIRNRDIVPELLFGLSGLCNLFVSSIVLLVESLVLVLVYREMMWREREVQSPPLDSPAEAP